MSVDLTALFPFLHVFVLFDQIALKRIKLAVKQTSIYMNDKSHFVLTLLHLHLYLKIYKKVKKIKIEVKWWRNQTQTQPFI